MNRLDFDYRVRYRTSTFKANDTLLADYYSCVVFTNKGTVNAMINGNILLKPDESFSFNEKPYVYIETDFDIIFQDPDPNDPVQERSVTCVCSYYEKA